MYIILSEFGKLFSKVVLQSHHNAGEFQLLHIPVNTWSFQAF